MVRMQVPSPSPKTTYPTRREVIVVAGIHNRDQYDKALDAVKRNVATEAQKDAVAREARQAGPRGNAAREALK